jgi:assimilatory nitrate reductase catalytic subunit
MADAAPHSLPCALRRGPAARVGGHTRQDARALRHRVLPEPPLGIGTDPGVNAELAARLGYGDGSDTGPAAVFEELRCASAGGPAGNAGVTWERIDAEDGVDQPRPEDDRPGAPRLFTHTSRTPAGSARPV